MFDMKTSPRQGIEPQSNLPHDKQGYSLLSGIRGPPESIGLDIAQGVKGQTSPSGNRTPVSRVTGGDTHHYTNEDTCV